MSRKPIGRHKPNPEQGWTYQEFFVRSNPDGLLTYLPVERIPTIVQSWTAKHLYVQNIVFFVNAISDFTKM
jgi:hypothetical protein